MQQRMMMGQLMLKLSANTEDKASNIYYKDNPSNWDTLQQIVEDHQFTYSKIISSRKYSYLLSWIDAQLPLLNDGNYCLSTKCFWILSGLQDFPRCHRCGKQLKNRNASPFNGYKNRSSDKFLFCSAKCAANDDNVKLRIKETRQEKFGQYAPLDFKDKLESTKMKNHGDPHFTNKKQAKKTLLEKSGYDHNWKDPRCRQKCKDTYHRKTGYECPLSNPDVIKKAGETKTQKYDDPNFNNQEKSRKTQIEKFGVDHHMKLKSQQKKVQDKKKSAYGYSTFNLSQSKKTMIDRYNVEYAMQSHDIRAKGQHKYEYDGIQK